MGPAATAAIAIAALLDGLLGELPTRVHPVALFGRLVAPFDREWDRPKLVGTVVAVLLPFGAAAAVWGLVTLVSTAGWAWGAVAAGIALFVTTSLRLLVETAGSVLDASDSDPDSAREAIPALVGRNPAELTPPELRSGAVESAAENLADGLVGPLMAFVLGAQLSLALGAGAAVWVKAVNTLDSMLGYRSKPVGWASARLDDLVMVVPARTTAFLLAVAAGRPGALVGARAWAREPPSPNSGWPMATLAAALDVRLSKPGVYDLNPTAAMPSVADGRRAVRVVTGAGVLSIVAGGLIAWW